MGCAAHAFLTVSLGQAQRRGGESRLACCQGAGCGTDDLVLASRCAMWDPYRQSFDSFLHASSPGGRVPHVAGEDVVWYGASGRKWVHVDQDSSLVLATWPSSSRPGTLLQERRHQKSNTGWQPPDRGAVPPSGPLSPAPSCSARMRGEVVAGQS